MNGDQRSVKGLGNGIIASVYAVTKLPSNVYGFLIKDQKSVVQISSANKHYFHVLQDISYIIPKCMVHSECVLCSWHERVKGRLTMLWCLLTNWSILAKRKNNKRTLGWRRLPFIRLAWIWLITLNKIHLFIHKTEMMLDE